MIEWLEDFEHLFHLMADPEKRQDLKGNWRSWLYPRYRDNNEVFRIARLFQAMTFLECRTIANLGAGDKPVLTNQAVVKALYDHFAFLGRDELDSKPDDSAFEATVRKYMQQGISDMPAQ
jgi:hypothetical protein